jgi:hypothetical protein
MLTQVNIYNEETGIKEKTMTYSIGLKDSIIATIEQYFKGNFKTWEYPKEIEGLYNGLSMINKNRLYKQYENYIIQAWEVEAN